MEQLICTVDAVKGLHFHFGKEKDGIIKYLQKQQNKKTARICIGSPTQLLAIDVYCHAKNITVIYYDRKGNKFDNVTKAHEHVNKEYIGLNFFGLDYETCN